MEGGRRFEKRKAEKLTELSQVIEYGTTQTSTLAEYNAGGRAFPVNSLLGGFFVSIQVCVSQ